MNNDGVFQLLYLILVEETAVTSNGLSEMKRRSNVCFPSKGPSRFTSSDNTVTEKERVFPIIRAKPFSFHFAATAMIRMKVIQS